MNDRLPGQLGEAVDARLARFERERIVGRIFERDHTVWSEDPTEITNRLGWLTLAAHLRARLPELRAFAGQVAADGFTHAVLLGMGGSSLAPEMFAQCRPRHRRGLPRVRVARP